MPPGTGGNGDGGGGEKSHVTSRTALLTVSDRRRRHNRQVESIDHRHVPGHLENSRPAPYQQQEVKYAHGYPDLPDAEEESGVCLNKKALFFRAPKQGKAVNLSGNRGLWAGTNNSTQEKPFRVL